MLGGVGGFAGEHGSGDANQGAVTAVHLDGIGDQIKLGPVFTGDPAIVRPEPVQNELAGFSLGDEIAVRGKGLVSRHVEGDVLVLDRRPARSWEAVLRRMDGIAGALAAEVGDEQIDVRRLLRSWLTLLILIDAQEKVAGTENVEHVLVDGNVSAGPTA